MSDTLNTKSAGDMVSLTATDGHVLDAYVARPEGHPRGALVVAQDAYGVGTYIRSVCDSYAADGYVAVAPAIYDRQQRGAVSDHSPESQARARQLRAGLDWDSVLADVKVARHHVQGAGCVGIVGFCVGGSRRMRSHSPPRRPIMARISSTGSIADRRAQPSCISAIATG